MVQGMMEPTKVDHMPPHLHNFRKNLTKKAESNATTGNGTLIQRSKLLHIYHIYLQLTLRLGLLKSMTCVSFTLGCLMKQPMSLILNQHFTKKKKITQ